MASDRATAAFMTEISNESVVEIPIQAIIASIEADERAENEGD